MKSRFLLVLAALLLTLGCRAALAWNSIGHMSVAWVAYQKLTPAEKARVATLLKVNPYYKSVWLKLIPAGTSDADRDLYIFMMAATWPDEIKAKNSGYTGTNTPPPGEPAALNDGYKAKKAHKYWHYTNNPLGGDPGNLTPLSLPTATQKITALRAELAQPESTPLKSYDLVWLLHLVGDIHQPLHSATRVSGNPKGDLGGNDVKLTGSIDNLHSFWDDALGQGLTKNFMTAAKVAAALPDPDPALVPDDKEDDWTAESFKLAETTVYVNPPVGPGLGPFTPDAAYTAKTQQIAKERVALAGARLAVLIKEALQCTDKGCAN
jgi:S1/P1 Nuclease